MGMINRWIGIVTLGLMLSVNAALMSRDVLPDWFAGSPPESLALHLQPGDEINVQLGLFDGEGRRLGYAWTRSSRDEELIKVRHKTVLEPLRLSHEVVTPMVCIETDLNYHGKASLDQLRVRVFGFGMQIRLEGEFYPPDHFPCKWQAGARRGEFDLPAETTRALGDVIRPFDSLTGLTVGRSWRVKLLNPLAGIIPDWGPRHMMKDSLLVRVTGREAIEHRGAMVEAFVLEADRIRAWVGPNGQLFRQEFELPLIGRLVLVDEPYDSQTRERVLREARMNS
jgi:hypothetical protein